MARTINIRAFPEDLARKAKFHAFVEGRTLKDFIIKAIRKAVKEAEANAEVLRAKSLQRKEEKKSD